MMKRHGFYVVDLGKRFQNEVSIAKIGVDPAAELRPSVQVRKDHKLR